MDNEKEIKNFELLSQGGNYYKVIKLSNELKPTFK